MTDYDRGAYTPPTEEEAIAFDARTPRMRRPAPATLIGSVVVLIVLVASVLVFYWSGVRGANEAPQVVGKPALQIKSAPVADAKPVSDEADKLEVYDEEKGQASSAPQAVKPAFAPPPEQPAPRQSVQASAAPQPAPAAAAPSASAPQPAPALRQAQAAPAPTPAALKPVKAAAESAPPPADAAHAVLVQIGAFSSEAIADSEFAKAKAAFASYTVGKSKHVERAEVGGRVYYRTAFAGFDRAGAHAFCKALQAAKKGCIVK